MSGENALSQREQQVLRLLADGRTNREIAAALGLSTETVKTHVSSILEKLDVKSRHQAATWWKVLAEQPRSGEGALS
jgi:DNA-binding NarL/FixJ family response regulator